MQQTGKRIGTILITGIGTALICACLLFLSSLIPQAPLRDNCYESALYFSKEASFHNLVSGYFFSMQDNYADCILTQIIWQMDEKNPVISSLEAAYYSEETQYVDASFLQAMDEGLKANTEYVRYWHGSMVFLRPLFLAFNIVQIRVILALAVAAEMAVVVFLLLKREKASRSGCLKTAAFCLIGALILVHAYLIAASVEYVTTFLVLGAVLIILLMRAKKDKELRTEAFFASTGVVTCFVDFLTTETITFTIPMAVLLLILYENHKLTSIKDGIKRIFTNGICWLGGYAGMFAAKWGISGLVFGKEALKGSLSHAAERVSGTVSDDLLTVSLTKSQQYFGALWQNIGCLFPIKEEMTGRQVMLWLFLILLVVAAFFYLFRTNEKHGTLFVPLLLLALLPYARFLALSNHACRHYFFTYRAQLITVFVLLLFIALDILPGIRSLMKKRM